MKNDLGTDVDVSELTLQNTETSEKIILPLGKQVNSPQSFGILTDLRDHSEFRVKKDQTFALKGEENIKYKVIDIQKTGVVIQKLDSGPKPA